MTGTRPLQDFEIQTLLTYLSDPQLKREKALIVLGIRTGLRLDCLLSLRLENVAVRGKVKDRIRIRRTKKSGKCADYEMPLHPQAAQALQDYLDIRGGVVGYVFKGPTSKNKLSRTHGYTLIKKAFEKAGLRGGHGELGSHTLRKTFCRLIYTALEHDLVKTAYAMRHASVSTTFHYLSFKEEQIDEAILSI